jgi:hypothetical protein
MNFPQSFNNGRGQVPAGNTPIIGQQQVPMVTFQIQVTQEMMSALTEYAQITGLDGVSLMNHVFNRGLVAIKQDYLNAQEPKEYEPPEEGATQE